MTHLDAQAAAEVKSRGHSLEGIEQYYSLVNLVKARNIFVCCAATARSCKGAVVGACASYGQQQGQVKTGARGE